MDELNNILLELTNVCNYNCNFCPQSITTRKKHYMSVKTIEKAINEIGKKKLAKSISFHLLGEPLLNKNFIFAIKTAHHQNVAINLYTNGSLLSKEIIDILLSFNINQINISLRNFDAISKRKYRAFKSYDNFINKIAYLICTNIENGGHTKINLMAFKDTIFTRFYQKRYGYDLYFKYDSLNAIIEKSYKNLGINRSLQIKKRLISIKDKTEFAKNSFVELNFISIWDSAQHQKERYYNGLIGNCRGLKREIGVLCTGDVVPCCRDYDGTMKLGNIHENSIEEIMSNSKAKYIRSALNKNFLPTEFCKRCRGGPSPLTSIMKQIGSIIVNGSFFSRRML